MNRTGLRSGAISGCRIPTRPHGVSEGTALKYQSQAFAAALSDGYMTMDVLGAIGFGWLVLNNIKGHSNSDNFLANTGKVVLVYGSIMSLVYLGIAWIGANFSDPVANGGALLSGYMEWSMGTPGVILLGVIMTTACLTTAVGLTCASASFFSKNYRFVTYKTAAVSIVIVSTLVANAGLSTLIQVTLPLVVILHPVTITVVALAVYFKKQPFNGLVYGLTLLTATITGAIDAAKITGAVPEHLAVLFSEYLPLYQFNACWITPSLLVFVLSITAQKFWQIRGQAIPA